MSRIQTLSPEFIAEAAWAIEQVKRLVKGGLQPGEPDLTRAPNGVVVVSPSDGIAARDTGTLYGELCYLYRILDTDYTDNEITLEAILDGSGNCMRQRVFNTEGSAAAGDAYFVSERLRSGHRYVRPATDQRAKIWRSQHTSTSNKIAGNTDVSTYNGIETRYTGGSDQHPDVTVDTSAKTITFNTAGNYRVGVHLSVSVAFGATASEAKISCDPGSFRTGTFNSTAEYSASNFAQVTLWTGFGTGSGSITAFAETFVAAQVNDVLGVRIARTGDTTTSLDIYANLTLGRVWT